jgi:prepilin-type N-terminal cleavage/methylation domain-containing protein
MKAIFENRTRANGAFLRQATRNDAHNTAKVLLAPFHLSSLNCIRLRASLEKVKAPAQCAGFSLVELLVVISIIILLSIPLVLHQGAFDETIHLTNTTHEVVLVIQSAQQYSTSVVGGGSFGVHLQAGGNQNQIVFYRNLDADLSFGGTNRTEETYTLPGRAFVSSIIATGGGGSAGTDPVSIAFARPNPEPLFFRGANQWSVGSESVRIQLESGGAHRTVVILPTGRIFVEPL